ncbi:Alpha-ketoglutarate-dependent sulfonate dioxygenase [Apiospora phragmitis]|uniref:Alpha-ketoglutarate-dependent sulfonate dioxygenase n=1 Tax=Apiospora phragmitis TaxID=2905665 RepID=A0ABR1T7N6_9PEZI
MGHGVPLQHRRDTPNNAHEPSHWLEKRVLLRVLRPEVQRTVPERKPGLFQLLKETVLENHDIHVRHRWRDVGDMGKIYHDIFIQARMLTGLAVAIWDNRCTYHAATFDYAAVGSRTGRRVVSVGERPYLDPASTGRREALRKSQ